MNIISIMFRISRLTLQNLKIVRIEVIFFNKTKLKIFALMYKIKHFVIRLKNLTVAITKATTTILRTASVNGNYSL